MKREDVKRDEGMLPSRFTHHVSLVTYRGLIAAIVLLLVLSSHIFAHRLDEYLQATLVDIRPDNVRLLINLTPGVAVADRVLAQIDRDHDGVISASEAKAYAEKLKHDLTVQLDGRKLDLKLVSINCPDPEELRGGEGIIQVEFSSTPTPIRQGEHSLTIDNKHLPSISVYLVNAAWPQSRSIHIRQQKRNSNQSSGEILLTLNEVR